MIIHEKHCAWPTGDCNCHWVDKPWPTPPIAEREKAERAADDVTEAARKLLKAGHRSHEQWDDCAIEIIKQSPHTTDSLHTRWTELSAALNRHPADAPRKGEQVDSPGRAIGRKWSGKFIGLQQWAELEAEIDEAIARSHQSLQQSLADEMAATKALLKRVDLARQRAEAAEGRTGRYKTALQFYAAQDQYTLPTLVADAGETARNALEDRSHD